MTLKGHEAIDYAEANSLTLRKYADPTEEAREGITVEQARKVAQEDPSLIWLDVVPTRVVCRADADNWNADSMDFADYDALTYDIYCGVDGSTPYTFAASEHSIEEFFPGYLNWGGVYQHGNEIHQSAILSGGKL